MEESNVAQKFTEKEICLLTINEASFLSRIMDAPGRVLITDSKSLGSLAAKLKAKGMVRPFGKIEKKIRWKFCDDRFTPKTRALIEEIVRANLPFAH